MARVALVTGGTRGIGAAICVALKEQGRTVIANYAGNEKAAAAFHEETGLHVERFDVGNFQECERAVQRITEQVGPRSEEHTSELQSQFHLVCRLLLEKKKKNSTG